MPAPQSPPHPSRAAALQRLEAFLPSAGVAYARNRNLDLPGHPHVSGLSPYLRHRVLTEAEVLRAVRGAHGARAAEKFIDEVFWRSYWKGWLELRPGIWRDYRRGLARALDDVRTQAGLRRGWEAACRGETGIDAFDHWSRELAATGYLHNHARMWFASIWIFTLRLPWELGADFFLRHLVDGDPASNTLSWRWVAGLQTRGKTYLARADNIESNTRGRFRPEGLALQADALQGPPLPEPGPLPRDTKPAPGLPTGLLVTEEDLSPLWAVPDDLPLAATAAIVTTARRSSLAVSPRVTDWVSEAMDDALGRLSRDPGPVYRLDGCEAVLDWARDAGLSQVILSYPPTGPTQEALADLPQRLADAGIRLVQRIRPEDTAAWPRATHGFFRFREAIPKLLAAL